MPQRIDRLLLPKERHRTSASGQRPNKRTPRHRASEARSPLRALLPPMAQRVAHRLPNSALRRLASDDAFEVSDAFEGDLRAQRGTGRPLDAAVADGMAGRLGQDLSGIRVHTDEAADRLAGSIQARAFTHGQDVFFAHGAYDPQSESGRFTLAHELAHATDAQDRPASRSSGRLVVGSANDPAEARADAAAMHGAAVAALRRQETPEEEEELQMLRRQEEEETIQPVRRQEEEELQALRRQIAPDLVATRSPLRREGLPIVTAEEEQATAREAGETEEGPAEETAAPEEETDEEQPTHFINQRLDVNERGRPVSAADLRQRIADAEARGHEVIEQARSSGTRVYEIIPRTEPITPEQTISPNGVAIVVKNATAEEIAALQTTLARVPAPHLQEFVSRRRRLVMVDWTGAPHESVRQMSGGANIARARPDIGEEAGSRIEITHTAMASGSGELTVLHEIGHVVYDANLIPRSVARDNYGVSMHTGASEQPAYAYMWYLLNPGRLDPQDRRAFDAAFQRQGLGSGGLETARPEEATEEEAEVQPLRRQEEEEWWTPPPLPPTEGRETQPGPSRGVASVVQGGVGAGLRAGLPPQVTAEEHRSLYSRDYPEEEELQMLRREVQGGAGAGLVAGILTQTITEDAARAMTTVELRQTRERLTTRFFTDPSAEQTTPVPSANLQVVEAELARREGALAAMTTEELSRQCNRELSRLQRWMLSPGGLALQTLRAYDGAVGNFVDFTGVSSPGGVQFSDVFGIVVAFVPGIGPLARWIGQEAIRAATVAAAQAAAGAAVQRGTSMATEAGTATEQGARASFAAQVRAESAALADALARNVDGALSIYERAVDVAQGANDADWLRRLLVALQHENDQVRAIPVARYAELARQFEIELYRRHYRSRAYIHVIEHNVWGVTSRQVRGIPDSVQSALIGRLRAADSMLSLARSWSLPESVTRTSGGRF